MAKYIDAEVLKNFDFNKIFNYKASYEICLGIETVLMIAEKMPSAKVQEIKHGRWSRASVSVCNGTVYHLEPRFACSQCNRCVKNKSDFCPTCGAKMDADENTEQTKEWLESEVEEDA